MATCSMEKFAEVLMSRWLQIEISSLRPQNMSYTGETGDEGREYLLVDVPDGLLALAVHVEDLQESLVHPLITCEASLQTRQLSAHHQQAKNNSGASTSALE